MSSEQVMLYSALQKYWNGNASSFVFGVHWSLLGLRSKYEYELLFPGIYT